MTDMTDVLRLEVQTAANDVFVWGVSSWTGYRYGGPADTPESGIEWLDILGKSHSINIRRGVSREGLTLSLDAGTMTAMIHDAQVDPSVNPYIKPGTPVRLVHTTGDVPVFTGVIRQVKVTYTKEGKTRVNLSAVDRTKDLGNISRSGVVSGTFSQRVGDLLDKHGVPNTVSGSSGLVLAQNAYDSTLLNHLTLAATSEQGRFFVSKDNVVKALGKNAVYPAAPSLWFTDKRYPSTTMHNLSGNPTFQNGVTKWQIVNGTLTQSTDWSASGETSGKYTATSAASTQYAFSMPHVGPTSNQRYTHAVGDYVYTEVTVYSPVAIRVGLGVSTYNSAGGNIGTALGTQYTEVPANTPTRVIRKGTSADTNALAIGALPVIYFYKPGTTTPNDVGTVVYLDNHVYMRNEGDAHAFFDGNSVGGSWDGTAGISSSTYTGSDVIEYTDIQVSYDSAALVNDIYVNNLTHGYNEEMEPVSINTKHGPFRNVTSIATYGAYTEDVDTNLSSPLDIEEFAESVLNDSDSPQLRVNAVSFNATDNTALAAGIEVFDLVNVEYDNETVHIGEDFSVLAIEHNITAGAFEHKWLVNVDLENTLGGTS